MAGKGKLGAVQDSPVFEESAALCMLSQSSLARVAPGVLTAADRLCARADGAGGLKVEVTAAHCSVRQQNKLTQSLLR